MEDYNYEYTPISYGKFVELTPKMLKASPLAFKKSIKKAEKEYEKTQRPVKMPLYTNFSNKKRQKPLASA